MAGALLSWRDDAVRCGIIEFVATVAGEGPHGGPEVGRVVLQGADGAAA